MTTREPTHNQGWYTLFPAVGTVAGLLPSRSDDVAVRATGVGVLLLEVIEEEEPAATTSRTTQDHQVGTGSWEVSSEASGELPGRGGWQSAVTVGPVRATWRAFGPRRTWVSRVTLG